MKTEIKEQKEGLRLDYFLSLGLKLVEGDKFTTSTFGECTVETTADAVTCNAPSEGDNKRVITSFAPRENTGVQPCGGDVPVIAKLTAGGELIGLAGEIVWKEPQHIGGILNWKPDLEALIKMQAEYDKQLERKEPEWKNGDEFIIHKSVYIVVGENSVGSIVGEKKGFHGVYKAFHKKDLKRSIDEREQKAKALYDLFNKCWELESGGSSWESCPNHLKNTYRKLIDAGVELPSNEQ